MPLAFHHRTPGAATAFGALERAAHLRGLQPVTVPPRLRRIVLGLRALDRMLDELIDAAGSVPPRRAVPTP